MASVQPSRSTAYLSPITRKSSKKATSAALEWMGHNRSNSRRLDGVPAEEEPKVIRDT